jgi:hypothetical protein
MSIHDLGSEMIKWYRQKILQPAATNQEILDWMLCDLVSYTYDGRHRVDFLKALHRMYPTADLTPGYGDNSEVSRQSTGHSHAPVSQP